MKIEVGKDNPKLRQKSREIEKIDKNIWQLSLVMKEMLKENNGVGLAAPQVGQSLRMFVFEDLETKEIFTFINPIIKKMSSEIIEVEEGCLSLPNWWGEVERSKKITVEGIILEKNSKNRRKWRFSDIEACIIQHEIDHLDGILFVDKAKNLHYQIPKSLNSKYEI